METEVRAEESVKAAKRPNGAVPNGTCSPDSGHPSSRNFSITSGFSDRSFSTEDSGAGTESAAKTSGQQPPQAPTKPQQQEGASPSKKTPVHGTEDADRGQVTEETVPPVSKGAAEETRPAEKSLTTNASSEDLLSATGLPSEEGPPPGEVAGLPVLEMQVDEEAEKQSLVGSEDNLSEEPEMESLFPQFVSLAVGAEGKTEATSPVSSIGVTYSVRALAFLPHLSFIFIFACFFIFHETFKLKRLKWSGKLVCIYIFLYIFYLMLFKRYHPEIVHNARSTIVLKKITFYRYFLAFYCSKSCWTCTRSTCTVSRKTCRGATETTGTSLLPIWRNCATSCAGNSSS